MANVTPRSWRTGSGNGIKKIAERAVDFTSTDSPLSSKELAKRRLVQMPMLIGGIVPVLNVPGIASNRMLLSAGVLADITVGRIAKWRDARIIGLTPGLSLPSRAIVRIVRFGKSETTEGYTRYLSEVSFAGVMACRCSRQKTGERVPHHGVV